MQSPDILYQEYLQLLYNKTAFPYSQSTNFHLTRGEILFPSIEKLLSIITINEQDIFLDLGSGKGQVVVQVFLRSKVSKSHGIEINSPLYQQSMMVAHCIQKDWPNLYLGREMEFFHGDFLQLPFNSPSIVFINSVCFDQDLLLAIGNKINNTPSIRVVLTLRAMHNLQHFRFKKTVLVECSWDSALCYIYEKVLTSIPK